MATEHSALKHRLIEFGAAILVLVLSLLLAKKYPGWTDELLSGVVGFLIPVIVVEVMILRSSIVELKESNEHLRNALSRSIERSIPDLAFVTKYATADISATEMPKVWSELSWLIQESYVATNWMKPQSIYEQPWGESALAVQRVKAQCRCADIRKVLIVDNVAELESPKLKKELQQQRDAEIKIHYLEHAKLNATLPLQPFRNLQIDFGIFDGRYLLLWMVNEKRRLTGGKLVVDEKEIKAYSDYFNQLLANSSPYDARP